MNKRLIAGLIISCAVFTLTAQSAQAHVLITDNSGAIGAILHVSPDDDPIAGEPSTLFFDIQNQSFSKHAHTLNLKITDQNDQVADISVGAAGSSVAATYTFPAQGVYTIALTANAEGAPTVHAHTFTHSQRVSRGVAGSALDVPRHEWAEMLLIGGLIGLMVLGIVVYNRRREITLYSRG